ncbi:hypothetical protein [Azospirillum lipoferum]|uniref:hypothetical protein n=1 Tax=Azospirillum lipoferum TaxID=193 RepID=UPI001395CB89|nr:hypothetical protein [Azospirillum lipoferum]
MASDAMLPVDRPNFILMLLEGLPDDIESEFRTQLGKSNSNLMVIRQPHVPYAGIELYLPTAIALFVTAGFFNGVLQELGKDAYGALKKAAFALWKRADEQNITLIGSAGKVPPIRRYSAAYSITGEISPGIKFKFIVQTDISADNAESGIEAFITLIDNIIKNRISEEDLNALLTYQPIGRTVLVTFDSVNRKIIPVDALADRRPPAD